MFNRNILFNIFDRDNAVTIAAGNAYFDYGELSKFLVQMPIVSWNGKTKNFLNY